MADVPIEAAAAYAAADAAIVLRLMPELEKEFGSRKADELFRESGNAAGEVLADMEMAGIALDTDFPGAHVGRAEPAPGEIEGQVFKLAGQPFNINSPQQLSEVLFDRMKLAPPDRTARDRQRILFNLCRSAGIAERQPSGGGPGAGIP